MSGWFLLSVSLKTRAAPSPKSWLLKTGKAIIGQHAFPSAVAPVTHRPRPICPRHVNDTAELELKIYGELEKDYSIYSDQYTALFRGDNSFEVHERTNDRPSLYPMQPHTIVATETGPGK